MKQMPSWPPPLFPRPPCPPCHHRFQYNLLTTLHSHLFLLHLLLLQPRYRLLFLLLFFLLLALLQFPLLLVCLAPHPRSQQGSFLISLSPTLFPAAFAHARSFASLTSFSSPSSAPLPPAAVSVSTSSTCTSPSASFASLPPLPALPASLFLSSASSPASSSSCCSFPSVASSSSSSSTLMEGSPASPSLSVSILAHDCALQLLLSSFSSSHADSSHRSATDLLVESSLIASSTIHEPGLLLCSSASSMHAHGPAAQLHDQCAPRIVLHCRTAHIRHKHKQPFDLHRMELSTRSVSSSSSPLLLDVSLSHWLLPLIPLRTIC